MPWIFQVHCPDCDYQWEATFSSFSCGSIHYQAQEEWRYFCSRCLITLYVPRVVDRNSWLNWIAGDAREIFESPLLIATHEQIARTLSRARSRYAPVPIEAETIFCCREPMTPGDIDDHPLSCPRCSGRSARSLGCDGHVSLLVDSDRPRPSDEEIERVIDRLRVLSQSQVKPQNEPPRVSFPSNSPHPLWDRDLDDR